MHLPHPSMCSLEISLFPLANYKCEFIQFALFKDFGIFHDVMLDFERTDGQVVRGGMTASPMIFCPRRTVFVGDYVIAVMRCLLLFVCSFKNLLISFEPDFRSS